MNKKKEKKPIMKKVEDSHVTNDIMHKRKFKVVINKKPVAFDPMRLTVKPKHTFKLRMEGSRLIFQKIMEEHNKIPPKEDNEGEKGKSEDEHWLEKENREMDTTLVNKEMLEREREKKEEEKKEENTHKKKEEKKEELKNELEEKKPLALKLLTLSTALGAIKKVKYLEEVLELTDEEKKYFLFS
jgi:hypothetical protein